MIGELSLTGEVRAVRGVLAVAEGVRRAELDRLVVPRSRAREAALVPGIEVVGVDSLQHLVATLRGDVEPAALPGRAAGRRGAATPSWPTSAATTR